MRCALLCLHTALACHSTTLWAGQWAGTLGAGLQGDNRYSGNLQGEGRQSALIQYRSDNGQYQATADYLLTWGEQPEVEIYQLYQELANPAADQQLRLGRFVRLDSLGMYHLDGVQWQFQQSDYHWQLYGGQPRRVDDRQRVKADYLAGIRMQGETPITADTDYPAEWQASPLSAHDLWLADRQWQLPQPALRYRGELQLLHYQQPAALLGSGITYIDRRTDWPGDYQQFNGQWAYNLRAGRFDNVQLDASLVTLRQQTLQLRYEYYEPDTDNPSFRQRFYSAYQLGNQHIAELGLYRHPRSDWQWHAVLRHSAYEQGHAQGLGGRTGVELRPKPAWTVAAELDLLQLGDDQVQSLWGRLTWASDAFTRWQFESGVQRENKTLYGANRALGARVHYQKQLRHDLQLTLYADGVLNESRHHDYRMSAMLTYHFGAWQ